MKLGTQPYKGTRDFYPQDKRLQTHIFGVWRKVVERFGYEEYDAPILEPFELYAAKTGDEIVNEQTYEFTDRGGRKVAIRPEMTPSVSRMVAAKRQELPYPLRWYSIPNLWRYERPQRGRLREHWQLNVDIFGVSGLEAEHELVLVADSIMQEFGAKRSQYIVKLNSRKLVDYFLADYLGLDGVQVQTMSRLIDKMRKIAHAEFIAAADAILTPTQREQGVGEKLLDGLNVKDVNELPEEVYKLKSVGEIKQLINMLHASGVKNIEFDFALMRGFDYYTDIVFEIFDTDPENNRSMFGGGRYDGLVGLFGAEPLPTAGFGMGDVTFANFLQKHKLVPILHTETDVYVIVLSNDTAKAHHVINSLRQMGLNVAVDYSGRNVSAQTKTAVKKKVRYVLYIGDQELDTEQFTLKDLATKEEQKRSLQRAVSLIKDHRKR